MTTATTSTDPEIIPGPYGDWNDLHVDHGPELVRQQLSALLESPAPSLPSAAQGGAGSKKEGGAFDLTAVLKRFVWTTPDGKVYDHEAVAILKKNQLADWIGKKLFSEWMASPERRTMEHRHALKLTRTAAKTKGAGDADLEMALERFVLLYPSNSIWDKDRCEMVRADDVKALLNRHWSSWNEHPRRQVNEYNKVVFDPTQRVRPEDGYINMFRGLPLRPVQAQDKCRNIRRLIDHLVDHNPVVFDWLVSWLAYPLQNVGAKMGSTVLMHSEQQGGGKSLFFEECYKPIFGEYAATVGQTQMESQYTDWRSKRLFGLFEEVLSRGQKYNHVGTIKHMVTGKTMRVEKKFVVGWEEANHMNFVFLSNEEQPLPIEPNDRRVLVVRPTSKLPTELRDAVLHELANGGIEAFYGWLLRWQMPFFETRDGVMEAFHTHTEPPMTDAKRRIIDFGLPSWEHFFNEWKSGDTELPFETCRATDLFTVYCKWCNDARERPLSIHKFSLLFSNRVPRKNAQWYVRGVNRRKGAFFWVDEPTDGKKQEDWLGERVDKWTRKIDAMGSNYAHD